MYIFIANSILQYIISYFLCLYLHNMYVYMYNTEYATKSFTILYTV
jgi:hypothetical protein